MANADVDYGVVDASNASTDAYVSSGSTVYVTSCAPTQKAACDVSAEGAQLPLSKKAQKKAAKAVYFAEKKLERRVREKAAKKEKKREKRERAEAAEDDEQPKKKARVGRVRPFNARVVVDLGFDKLMSDKEISSLSSQLAYTYSANRRAPCPFSSLLYTSINGRLRARLDSQNNADYRRWTNTEWWEEDYARLWVEEASTDSEEKSEEKGRKRSKSEKDKVVYLTADADEELEELKEGETYIIGGIVDHNRYKNLCLKRAAESDIRSARLPIGKYLAEMTTRKVLTVNQVFEILVHWTESRNWEEAMHSVMPKRKFQQSDKLQPRTLVQKAGVEADGDTEPKESKPVEEVEE